MKAEHTLEELMKLIQDWGAARGLATADFHVQMLKMYEEIGETAGAILRGNTTEVRDGIGDILVTYIICLQQQGVDIVEKVAAMVKEDKRDLGFDNIFTGDSLGRELSDDMVLDYMLYFRDKPEVVLTHLGVLAKNTINATLNECLQFAYDEIKDRKGKLVNGTFIKEGDLK